MFSRFRPSSSALAAALAVAAMLVTLPLVMGYWGALHPFFDSLGHFRVHLAGLLVLMALPLLLLRAWRWVGLGMVALGVAAVASVTVTSEAVTRAGAEAQAATASSARYRLMHLNLRFDNRTPRRVLSLIGRELPDVVTLNEVSGLWREELALIREAYPHRIICPEPSRIGGVAILSRRPFLHPSRARCFDRGAMAVATINVGGVAVDVAALHLGWPWPFPQHRQIDRLAPELARLGSTALLAADLNAAPWSAAARRVAAAGELDIIGDIGPTWLALPLPDLLRRTAGLPIDNIMVKGGIVPFSTRRLEDVGSDHLPVLMEFSVRMERPPVETMQAMVGRE